MQLESLANEVLLELFEYLDGTHLFRAFYGLNIRFNHLLLLYHRTFYFNFQQIPKEDFDVICQQYLPSVIDRVISIEISDDIETPKLPELFLDYGFTLDQFINLKRLTLHSINSLSTLLKITCHCQSFPNLEYLNITICFDEDVFGNHTDFFNNIWALPKLTSFIYYNSRYMFEHYPLKISQISPSIKSLTLKNCKLSTLPHLLIYTPNLQRLDISVERHYNTLLFNINVFSLTYLKIHFNDSYSLLIYFFKGLPNLHHLIFESSSVHWNGYEWKGIIEKYFPKLKILQFKIIDYFLEGDTTVDDLLETFRTSFWLEEHQWFVGCQWNPHYRSRSITFYTLPYAFDSILYHDDCCFKSTLIRVHTSRDSSFDKLCFDSFPNIRDLSIQYLSGCNFLSLFPSLHLLKSLIIELQNDHDYRHLQVLLDNAPCLYSLTLDRDYRSYKRLFELTSSSVRQLHLFTPSIDFRMSTEDCIDLISSPLGRQCEVLSVNVDSEMDALILIQQMLNLRSLKFFYKGAKWTSAKKCDEFVRWLENHLPSTCAMRGPEPFYSFDIWINRRKKDAAPLSKAENNIVPRSTKLKRFFRNLCLSN